MAKGFNSRGRGGMGGGFNMSMIRQAQKMQQDMLKKQSELEGRDYTAKSGGGAVEVTVSGKRELKGIIISPEVVNKEDVEMLQDLIMTAFNEAMRMANQDANDTMGALTGGLNLSGYGL